jgi:hypothetical protein
LLSDAGVGATAVPPVPVPVPVTDLCDASFNWFISIYDNTDLGLCIFVGSSGTGAATATYSVILIYRNYDIVFMLFHSKAHTHTHTHTMLKLDATVWGPHYWFFLMTVAVNYPDHVNDVTRKKYYDFIQNFAMFIPDPEMSSEFSRMLDKYPVTPYLDSRTSFIKWVHFIHNRYNVLLMKDEMPLHDALERYYLHYRPKPIQILEELKYREKLVYFLVVVGLGYAAYYYHNR